MPQLARISVVQSQNRVRISVVLCHKGPEQGQNHIDTIPQWARTGPESDWCWQHCWFWSHSGSLWHVYAGNMSAKDRFHFVWKQCYCIIICNTGGTPSLYRNINFNQSFILFIFYLHFLLFNVLYYFLKAINPGWWEIDIHGCYWLVRIAFVPICACKNNREIWCHNASTPRSRDVKDQLWWRHNAKSEKTVLGENSEISDR